MKPVAVLAASVLVLAGAALVFLASRGEDEYSAAEADWWEPLVAFAPAAGTDEGLILTNAEVIDAKYGIDSSAPCDVPAGSSASPEAGLKADQHSRHFYWFLFPPDVGLGFDACQVRAHAFSYGLGETAFYVFVPNVSSDQTRSALIATGYSQSDKSGIEVFERPPLDDDLSLVDDLHYVAISEPFVITSSSREVLLRAVNERSAGSDLNGPAHAVMTSLEPFDAAWLLRSGQLAELIPSDLIIERCGLNCTDEQISALHQSIVASARDAGWSHLQRPNRVAVAFVAGEQPTMKVALLYMGSHPATAAAELKVRLQTYEPIAMGQRLCDSAEAHEVTTDETTIVVGTCHGGRAESWFTALNNLLLVEKVE